MKDNKDYYIFEFEKDSNETPVTLKFEKLEEFDGYKNVEFFYKASSGKTYDIENDYFECVDSSKTFLLKSNSEK